MGLASLRKSSNESWRVVKNPDFSWTPFYEMTNVAKLVRHHEVQLKNAVNNIGHDIEMRSLASKKVAMISLNLRQFNTFIFGYSHVACF